MKRKNWSKQYFKDQLESLVLCKTFSPCQNSEFENNVIN